MWLATAQRDEQGHKKKLTFEQRPAVNFDGFELK
jgi:hypothetical protein